jgi:hypothetical protein
VESIAFVAMRHEATDSERQSADCDIDADDLRVKILIVLMVKSYWLAQEAHSSMEKQQ